MNNGVLTEYTKYINNSLLQFFRILLGNTYSAGLVKPLVNKYIDVRYFNNTIYEKDKDIVSRINKELNLVAKEMINEDSDNAEVIKNVVALFGYIFYFDDCIMYDDYDVLCDALFNDETIKLKYFKEKKKEIVELINEVNDKKSECFKLFMDYQDFELKFKRLIPHVFSVDILEHCKVSKLYSDYAIDRAFNTGTLSEDKIYLLLVLLNFKVLCDAVSQEYQENYIVSFPASVLTKPKKIIRYHNVLENDYLKDHIYLSFTYTDYVENKKEIKKLITMGYKVAVILDDSFKMNVDSLAIFSYLLVFKDTIYYDALMDIKDSLNVEIIEL